MTATATTPLLDALVIGGGPAGLTAALTMARALQAVAVFDSGVYRNRRATHMHNLPTWDHKNPAEFRRAARDEMAARYKTVQFFDNTTIAAVERNAEGRFVATAEDGRAWVGRALVLATGVEDVMPDIEGYDECWAKGIFHCLFCHGYEERGAPSAGVLAVGDIANSKPALLMARSARQLVSDKVTIYTNGQPTLAASCTADMRPDEAGHFILDDRPIVRLVKGGGPSDVTVHFADGTSKTEGFLVHKPKTQLNGPFAAQLGLALTPQGDVVAPPPTQETNVPGVYAAGDCAVLAKIVASALATGACAGAGATHKLQARVI